MNGNKNNTSYNSLDFPEPNKSKYFLKENKEINKFDKNELILDYHNTEYSLLSQILEYCSFTSYQIKIIICLSISMLFYGFHMTIISLSLSSYMEFYKLSIFKIIILTNCLYFGSGVGSLTISYQYKYITNNRKLMLIINFTLGILFSFLFSLVNEFFLLCALRVFIGVNLGFIQPVVNNLALETLPPSKKNFIFVSTISCGTLFGAISLVLMLIIMPNLEVKFVPKLILELTSILFICYLVFTFIVEDSVKNQLGRENIRKGFDILKNCLIKEKKIDLNEHLRKKMLFEIKYPVLAFEEKLKYKKKLELEKENDIFNKKEYITKRIKEMNSNKQVRSYNDYIKEVKEEENYSQTKIEKQNEEIAQLVNNNNANSKEISNIQNNNENNGNDNSLLIQKITNLTKILTDSNNSNDDQKNKQLEQFLVENTSHMFDSKYYYTSICNIILLCGNYFLVYGMISLQNVLSERVANMNNKAAGVGNSTQIIYNELAVQIPGIISPIFAGFVSQFKVMGIKYSVFLGFMSCALGNLLCIFNVRNLITYLSLSLASAGFNSGLIYCLISQCYDVKIADHSVGVVYLCGKFTITICIALVFSLINYGNINFIIFVIISFICAVTIIIHPEFNDKKHLSENIHELREEIL